MLTMLIDTTGLNAKIAAAKPAAERGLKTGVEAGAMLFEADAKALVPVVSGRLQEAIHTEVLTDEPTMQARAVTPAVEASNKWGFDPPYARRIERGFIGVDSLGRHYNQAAQPYMAPAFENNQAAALDGVKSSVLAELAGVA